MLPFFSYEDTALYIGEGVGIECGYMITGCYLIRCHVIIISFDSSLSCNLIKYYTMNPTSKCNSLRRNAYSLVASSCEGEEESAVMLKTCRHSGKKTSLVFIRPGKDMAPLLSRSAADDKTNQADDINSRSSSQCDVTNNNKDVLLQSDVIREQSQVSTETFESDTSNNELYQNYSESSRISASEHPITKPDLVTNIDDIILTDSDSENSTTENVVSVYDKVKTTSGHCPSSVPRPTPLAALRMNLSFAGCGFLGMYHLGVVHAMAQHGRKLLLNVQRYGGASAGSLIASALAVRGPDLEVIQECVEFCFSLADDIHSRRLGVLTPRLSLLEPLEAFLTRMFPDDAHIRASGRLYVSVTDARTKKNHIMSDFNSKEQLIKYLLGSSYVPFVTGSRPVKVDGKKYLDGGMTNNLPDLPNGRTILVTPFAGGQHICPRDKPGRGWYIHIQGEDFQVNAANLKRGLHAFFPPKRKHLEKYFDRGKRDAIRFLKAENFYSEEPELDGEVLESTRM